MCAQIGCVTEAVDEDAETLAHHFIVVDYQYLGHSEYEIFAIKRLEIAKEISLWILSGKSLQMIINPNSKINFIGC